MSKTMGVLAVRDEHGQPTRPDIERLRLHAETHHKVTMDSASFLHILEYLTQVEMELGHAKRAAGCAVIATPHERSASREDYF